MINEVTKIIEESKVEESTAVVLQSSFSPFFEKAMEWEQAAKAIIVTDATQVEQIAAAHEMRLALKEIRINADKKRKELKEDSLRYGKAVQGVYNVIEFLIVPLEKHLEKQEKFAELQEEEKRIKLLAKRQEEIAPYAAYFPISSIDVSRISEEEYILILNGAKMQYQNKIEQDQKDIAEKAARDKADAEERERVRQENEKLKAEAAARDAQLKAETAKREKAEKELQDKKAKEDREKRQAAAQEKKAANAPDKEKIVQFLKQIEALDYPVTQSNEAKAIVTAIHKNIAQVVIAAYEQAGEL